MYIVSYTGLRIKHIKHNKTGTCIGTSQQCIGVSTVLWAFGYKVKLGPTYTVVLCTCMCTCNQVCHVAVHMGVADIQC